MFEPAVAEALAELTGRLGERFPEIADEIENLPDEKSVQQALLRITQLTQDRPEMVAEINAIAMEVFAPLRGEAAENVATELEAAPDLEASKQLPAFAGRANAVPTALTPKMIFQPPGARLPRLDPMVEAAIAERAQFDGDVPELRSGNLVEGMRPAVPVHTTARNPVAVGQMLRSASDEVVQEAKALSFDQEQKLLAAGVEIDEDGKLNLPATMSPADLQLIAPDPEGYKRGNVPALRTVETPTGSALAALSPEDRAVSAYEALSTTQGRKSAVAVIRELVEVGLKSDGFDVRVNEYPNMGLRDVPVCVEWTTQLSSGPRSTQANFSFIDIAAKVLTRKIMMKIQEGLTLDDPVLEVIPINTVDVRRVGWAARIIEGAA